MLTRSALSDEFGQDIHFFGPRHISEMTGVLSFTLEGIHPHDIAQILDEDELAVRAGHHCAQPLHTLLGISATIRASFYLYNDESDVKRLIIGLRKARQLFKSSVAQQLS